MEHLLIAYSWSVNNIGDMAITPGLISSVKRLYPGTRISLLSNLTAGSDDFLTAKAWYAGHYPDIAVFPNPFVPPAGTDAPYLSAIAAKTWGKDASAYERGVLPFERSDEITHWIIDAFADAVEAELGTYHADFYACLDTVDAVMYNSGTTFNFGRGEPFPPKPGEDAADKRKFWDITLVRSMPLVLARKHGMPYAVNGQSFEALDHPSDCFFRTLFTDAQFVSVRDPDSVDYLSGKGIGTGKLRFGPDSTFFYPGEDTAWAKRFLAVHSLADKGFISLIIRTSVQGYITVQREQSHLSLLRDFITQWVTAADMPVLLCPEVRIEIDVMRNEVYAKLPEAVRERCVFMDKFWSTAQAKAVYRASRIVVSMEMHSVILALAAGTPVLHPQFAEAGRKASMLTELGLGRWLFDIDHTTPYALFHAAMDISGSLDACAADIERSLARLAVLGEENIRALAASADERRTADAAVCLSAV
ncbi:MAG: polysaccharide pyruvyl transferase family protein [Spirochaetota bacterium]